MCNIISNHVTETPLVIKLNLNTLLFKDFLHGEIFCNIAVCTLLEFPLDDIFVIVNIFKIS